MNTDYTSNPNQSASLFPPLINQTITTVTNDNSEQDQQGELLWNNVNTFAIPDDSEASTSPPMDTSSTSFAELRYPSSLKINHINPSINNNNNNNREDSTAFNISWGGNDKPPTELHPEPEPEQPVKLTRPLPKPRGIRKLPEPEPSEDGTIDEDTLKRRKNTDAARRSRMKKFMKVDQLENKVTTLLAENAKLTLSNAVLESEKRSLNAKENEYKKRIKYLEDIMICQGWDFENNYHNSSDQW